MVSPFAKGNAKSLRARSQRLTAAWAKSLEAGTPRFRYWREQRSLLASNLALGASLLGGVTGGAAIVDVVAHDATPLSQTMAQGITAMALGVLAVTTLSLRRNLRGLFVVTVLAAVAALTGWAAVASAAGGAGGPYALAVPVVFALLVFALPLPASLPLPLMVLAMVLAALSAPGSAPLSYVLCLFAAGGGVFLARSRRRRSIRAWHRVERLRGILGRVQRNQERLVVVEKLEALRVLVGGMAHELNNALAVSVASVQHVARVVREDPEAAAKSAARAEGGLTRIRGTVDRLKRFAMAGEGVLEAADAASMLDFAIESAIGRARSGVIVDRSYQDDIGTLECHVSALAEALFQVAKNAVEAMPKGGTVHAAVRREGNDILLEVRDEGQGIPTERLPRVFDPFYAREGAETFTGRVLPPLPGRSGLGLSAVYGIVTAMGGKVALESKLGRGTRVVIRMPARAPR